MSHRSVVNLISDVSNSLSDGIQFGYGRRSDFNLIVDKRQTIIWLLPLTANPGFTVNNNTENYQKVWNCIVVFLQKDATDSLETEFAEHLHTTDELLDKFVIRLNDWSMKSADTVGDITLRNFSQVDQIKSDSDIFTGWILSFQAVVSDDFNYCTPENVEIYANS